MAFVQVRNDSGQGSGKCSQGQREANGFKSCNVRDSQEAGADHRGGVVSAAQGCSVRDAGRGMASHRSAWDSFSLCSEPSHLILCFDRQD